VADAERLNAAAPTPSPPPLPPLRAKPQLDYDVQHGVATDAEFEQCVDGDTPLSSLELANGDWLYVRRDPEAAVQSNAEVIARMKKKQDRAAKVSVSLMRMPDLTSV
jgi:hypothetical protein